MEKNASSDQFILLSHRSLIIQTRGTNFTTTYFLPALIECAMYKPLSVHKPGKRERKSKMNLALASLVSIHLYAVKSFQIVLWRMNHALLISSGLLEGHPSLSYHLPSELQGWADDLNLTF